MTRIRHIAVLTSGGDAPGMNAAIRAVVRAAASRDIRVTGVRKGFQGLLDADFVELGPRAVSNIIQRGGTILQSSRCADMYKRAGRRRAAETLRYAGVEALVTIGGNGTIRGALALAREERVKVAHVPSTIDNDLPGTEATIGHDTAVNVAVTGIDRLRDTAASHDRVFVVEVMGRHNGHIAVEAAIAGGAEAAFIPEQVGELARLAARIRAWKAEGKKSLILVLAEGDEQGGTVALTRTLRRSFGLDIRTCILGHTQRGGTPTARDRVLATTFGAAAVEALWMGKSGVMVSIVKNRLTTVPLRRGDAPPRDASPERFRLVERMA